MLTRISWIFCHSWIHCSMLGCRWINRFIYLITWCITKPINNAAQVWPSDAPQHRRKVQHVKAIVDQDLGFTGSSSPDSYNCDEDASIRGRTAFLFMTNKIVVGLLLAELIKLAYRLLELEVERESRGNGGGGKSAAVSRGIHRSNKKERTFLGIHHIWCHHSLQWNVVASKLVDIARSNIVYGMAVSPIMVDFSSPTAKGLIFTRNYVGIDTPLVYDCVWWPSGN